MSDRNEITRRGFLATVAGATVGGIGMAISVNSPLLAARNPAATSAGPQLPHALAALRKDMLDSPVTIGQVRARVFTTVFRANETQPWIVRKAMALREYFRAVPLYLRPGDRIAGAISEKGGAMPVMVELGIGENPIYTGENPKRKGYLKGKVPDDIREYWKNRNMWGLYRTEILGKPPYKTADEVPQALQYKFISNQGHLSPSYAELLEIGLAGVLARVRKRREGETKADCVAFLDAAEQSLLGVSEWATRYAKQLALLARICSIPARVKDLEEMSRIAAKIAVAPPSTFREAMQLIWFVHQAIHIEGHGYSCTPDHIDRLLLPYYRADVQVGRLTEDDALHLCENFVLKQFDNTFWGPEHSLTQGLCVGGSTPDGRDLTNELSWVFIQAATNAAVPDPLVWMRWHPKIDQEFFDFCLLQLRQSTCFPMMWSDAAIPAAFMELGVSREDAFDYIPVGCNELAVPGKLYYNPGAHCGYLQAIEAVLTSGKGYKGQWGWNKIAPAAGQLKTFDQFSDAVAAYIRTAMAKGFERNKKVLDAQFRWGKTPLTSCFFDGCISKARDMADGTKYNILSCGGIAFANAVDCLAAVREVVYEKKAATLAEVLAACKANFKGYEKLRAKLQAAPKHGNDEPRLDEIIRRVERMRDEPMKEICRDPRDGSKFGNSHVVRSGAVRGGINTPATPDGRLAGTPLASSVAASVGCERSGPTAVLNSVCKLNSTDSWQSGYQVNIRFHSGMIANDANRTKLRAMLNAYFTEGGQELQVNVVSTAALRAAQKDPDRYRDLVVRVAGFSEFFVNLTPEIQEDIIARMEHQ